MKIVVGSKKRKPLFGDIGLGEGFSDGGYFYIKIIPVRGTMNKLSSGNSVRLSDGTLMWYDDSYPVEKLENIVVNWFSREDTNETGKDE